jgi:hypothetical protein
VANQKFASDDVNREKDFICTQPHTSPHTSMHLPLAAMASLLAATLLLLSPAAVHGKNMKFSRTLSFDDNLGDALKDLVGDLQNSEKANKVGGSCSFKCDNGERAVKRAAYFPVSDGCMVRRGGRRGQRRDVRPAWRVFLLIASTQAINIWHFQHPTAAATNELC